MNYMTLDYINRLLVYLFFIYIFLVMLYIHYYLNERWQVSGVVMSTVVGNKLKRKKKSPIDYSR